VVVAQETIARREERSMAHPSRDLSTSYDSDLEKAISYQPSAISGATADSENKLIADG
jgi:hypothetical protein